MFTPFFSLRYSTLIGDQHNIKTSVKICTTLLSNSCKKVNNAQWPCCDQFALRRYLFSALYLNEMFI